MEEWVCQSISLPNFLLHWRGVHKNIATNTETRSVEKEVQQRSWMYTNGKEIGDFVSLQHDVPEVRIETLYGTMELQTAARKTPEHKLNGGRSFRLRFAFPIFFLFATRYSL